MEVKRKNGCLRAIGWIAVVLAWIILISAIVTALAVLFGVRDNIFRWFGMIGLPFGIMAFVQLYVIGKMILVATDVEYNTRVTAATVDNLNSTLTELKESGRANAVAISSLSDSVGDVKTEVAPLAAAVAAATTAQQAQQKQLPPPPPEPDPEPAPDTEPLAAPEADADADDTPEADADAEVEAVPEPEPDPDPEPEPDPDPVPASDDFTKLEGVGPKISGLLADSGITTYEQLANTSTDELGDILTNAGLRFANPESWPEQAKYAAAGDWDGLAEYQQSLRGGRVN